MRVEVPITEARKKSLEGLTAREFHAVLDEWFEEDHVEAYHWFEGRYDVRYYLSVRGDVWTAVAEYSRRDR